jgi:hypothetical protein
LIGILKPKSNSRHVALKARVRRTGTKIVAQSWMEQADFVPDRVYLRATQSQKSQEESHDQQPDRS